MKLQNYSQSLKIFKTSLRSELPIIQKRLSTPLTKLFFFLSLDFKPVSALTTLPICIIFKDYRMMRYKARNLQSNATFIGLGMKT